MINNFINKTTAGLYCEKGNFYIDPKKAVEKALVSHAHFDHAVSTNGIVFCTAPTKDIMIQRKGKRSMPDFRTVSFSKSFFIEEVKITFFPAGHMLGSAQILMEYEGERYLYTGDFKIQDDDSCEKFEYVECDHLITETTFASPEYNHPDPEAEIKKLLSENIKVIIGAYAVGKAQRLTKLISDHCKDSTVFVHRELEVFHKIYSDNGYSPGEWKPFRRADFESGEKNVYIVPPSYFRRFKSEANVFKVFATGWKKSPYRCDGILQISDHADWNDLLEMINKSKAKIVYTVHGKGNLLKEFLKDTIEVKIIG